MNEKNFELKPFQKKTKKYFSKIGKKTDYLFLSMRLSFHFDNNLLIKLSIFTVN
jgi:hypothetical protein